MIFESEGDDLGVYWGRRVLEGNKEFFDSALKVDYTTLCDFKQIPSLFSTSVLSSINWKQACVCHGMKVR